MTGSVGCGSADRPGGKVPDANRLWDFREALITANAFDALFRRLNRAITGAGCLPMSGQIAGATRVAAPPRAQHGRREGPEQRGQDRRRDLAAEAGPRPPERHGARWTVKFTKAKAAEGGSKPADIAIPTFGYKSHISIGRRHGIIRRSLVSDGAAHDGSP